MEIDFVRWDGDAYITVLVDSRGFSGRNDLHILASHFQDFCTNLVELQESLKGEARLVGVMDGELDVLIRPADALGHFSVIGSTGYHVGMAHTAY